MTSEESLDFYERLCIVVGTKETVKIRRFIYKVFDMCVSEFPDQFIFSGSKGEGLDFKESDIDLMIVNTGIRIYERPKDIPMSMPGGHALFIMDNDDTKPGFTKLKLHQSSAECRFIKSWCVRSNMYLSNVKYKLFFNVPGSVMHGPCISDPNGGVDFVSALQCENWVAPAQPWIQRPRRFWPSCENISEITKRGVLFVPIGAKGSSEEELEWRISFSVAEKQLMFSFRHTQFLCYGLLKMVLTTVKHTYDINLLCSYFLKTVMFWISEEVKPSFWNPENLITCFMSCFKRLIYCVEYSILPHYFISDNNMFENRFSENDQRRLLSILQSVYNGGWQCVIKSRAASSLRGVLDSKQHSVYDVLNSYECTTRLLHCMVGKMYCDFRSCFTLVCKCCSRVRLCPLTCGKEIHMCYLSLLSKHLSQTFFVLKTNNKQQYIQYRQCISYLLLGLHHDAVSGWLLLASLFYKMKHYEKSLQTIHYALGKCTSERFYIWYSDEDFVHNYLFPEEVMKLTRRSLLYIVRKYGADMVCFSANSSLIPPELQHPEQYVYIFTPIMFGYFLRFLCFHKLNHFTQCHDIINNMPTIIRRKDCLNYSKRGWLSNFKLLAVACHMIGRNIEALKYFRIVVKHCPNDSFALMKLAKLNREIHSNWT